MTKQIRVDSGLHRQAKLQATVQGISLQELVNLAVAEYLARLEKSAA
jgi:predicted HicB family RNase H-like nuclease